jgi:pimeloyl-ACP methyl ester carboxylesterase
MNALATTHELTDQLRSAEPQRVRFVTSDAVQLSTSRWVGADSASPPVVLHHGFAASTELNWVATGIVAALLAQGRTVLALDARGHGESESPHDPQFYGETRMATDLIEWLDSQSITQFDLFGYSMGAVVSLIVARRDPRVRRLVIGGVGEGIVVSGGVDLRVMQRDAVVAALLATDPALIADPGAALFRAFAQRSGADLKALAAQARRMHDQPIDLERIACPTLLLAGRDDALAASPQRLAEALPDARVRIVPGGHLDAVRAPEFASAAIDFLSH